MVDSKEWSDALMRRVQAKGGAGEGDFVPILFTIGQNSSGTARSVDTDHQVGGISPRLCSSS